MTVFEHFSSSASRSCLKDMTLTPALKHKRVESLQKNQHLELYQYILIIKKYKMFL